MNRVRHDADRVVRRRRAYPSDTTDAEWALIAPLLPPPAATTPRGGRPESHPRRAVVDAIRYLVDNGCKWRALPADFPPWRTVYGFFRRWTTCGVLTRIRDALREKVRAVMGRCANPVTLIIDSQSVKAAETVGAASRGYDAGNYQGSSVMPGRAHPAWRAACWSAITGTVWLGRIGG